MLFENPLMLYGGALGLIPIVMHLINRRRAQVHPFAAIEFIILSNKRIATYFKLKQLLVLLLRIAILVCLVFALSKPFLLLATKTGLFVTGKPTSTVIVIDDSYSMQAMVQGQQVFDRARAQALKVLTQIGSEDNVAVVLASSPPRKLVQQLSFDRRQVEAMVKELEPGYRTTDLQGALRLSEEILSESKLERQRIILITDLTRRSWDKVSSPWTLGSAPEVSIVDVGGTAHNIAISEVQTLPAQSISPTHHRIRVRLRSFSSRHFHGLVSLKLANTIHRDFVDVKPNEEGVKELVVKLQQPLPAFGTVELPDDDLRVDNVRHFAVRRPSAVRLLVINGSPRDVPVLDETYFVANALSPVKSDLSPIRAHFITPDALRRTPLDGFHVVFLCNVQRLSPKELRDVTDFVKGGGGVLISVGDNTAVSTYNRIFAELLPYRLKEVKTVAQGGRIQSDLNALYLAGMAEHPIFDIFRGLEGSSLFRTRTFKFVLLENTVGMDSSILVRYDNNTPALVEKRLGKGKIIMLTTTIDRDWTDLPIRSSFLPLIQQIARYLAPVRQEQMQQNLLIADPIRVKVGPEIRQVTVEPPSHKFPVEVFPREDIVHKLEVVYQKTLFPGLYHVSKEVEGGGQIFTESVVVNVDTRSESDLERITIDQATERLGPKRVGHKGLSSASGTYHRQLDLWPFLLLTFVLLLLAETAVLAKR